MRFLCTFGGNVWIFAVLVSLGIGDLALAAEPPAFLLSWGRTGSANGEFRAAFSVTVDGSGNVYVSDGTNHRVQKFTPDGTFLTTWGSNGSGNGQFNTPRGIEYGPDGNIYVIDANNYRVQKFDTGGTFLSVVVSGSGTGDGQFQGPHDLDFDSAGNMYVVDNSTHRVQKFDKNGNFLRKWGTQGTGDGQFESPYGITVGPGDAVYVVQPVNARVQEFDRNGNFVRKWGSPGNGDGQLGSPLDIEADPLGNLYVADQTNERIQMFDSDGNFILKFGTGGNGEGEFDDPAGVAFDSEGLLYVVERSGGVGNNDRVQKFQIDRAPGIRAVRDVPADEGGQVFLSWRASFLDGPHAGTITEYTIWRALAPEAAAFATADIGNPSLRRQVVAGQEFYWEYIASVTPFLLDTYGKIVPTPFDSTGASFEQTYWQVIAHTGNPVEFYMSAPDSGYSVDNLAPTTPALHFAKAHYGPNRLEIRWRPNIESDLAHYALYRGTTPGFPQTPGTLISTPEDTLFVDPGWDAQGGYYYKLTAVDVHENESDPTLVEPEDVTGVGNTPRSTFLAQNVPNPFNPTTEIGFGLEVSSTVTLRVYSVDGRLVRTLLHAWRPPGVHSVNWDGRDAQNEFVGTGIYFYELQTDAQRLGRKMLLLK